MDSIDRAVARLEGAARTGTRCAPGRDLIGADDLERAYAVQRGIVDHRIAAGARVSGRKIGLTSPAVQAQLGVDRPDFGVLFTDMAVAHDGRVPPGSCSSPASSGEGHDDARV
jgi:2-keto-4-pentenoate hydratase